MRHGRLVLLALTLGGASALAAPAAARADQITFTVPVQLSNLATEVTRGRVTCMVAGRYFTGVDPERRFNESRSSEFQIGRTRGEYQGAPVTVQVQVSPPQEWIDMGRTISVRGPGSDSAPRYVCFLQIATSTSGWHPQWPFDSQTLMLTGATALPSWASFFAGGRGIVTGTLQVANEPRPRN